MSEKVALVVQCLASFITGFALAYARNWRLALAMSSIIPCFAVAGTVMNIKMSRQTEYASFLMVDVQLAEYLPLNS